MSELLNTWVITTAESPWSKGITEKHNCIISNRMDKITEKVDYSMEFALI